MTTIQTRHPTRRWRSRPSWVAGAALSAPAIVTVVLLVIYPLLRLIWATIVSREGLDALQSVFAERPNRLALIRTLRVSAIVALGTLVLGSIMAWALCTARSKASKVILWMAVLAPFWMSVVIKNYAFVLLLQKGGAIHEFLNVLGIIGADTRLLYTETAVAIGMAYAMFPYAVLPLYATFSSLDRDLPTAAEGLGATSYRTWIDIIIPICSRGMLNAFTLVFVISLGFYVTPVILGGPSSPFAASAIGSDLFDYFDFAGAQALGTVLLCIAGAALILSQICARWLLPKGVRS